MAPAPLQGLHRYYEAVRPPAPHRYSPPRSFSCLGFSLTPTASTCGRTHRGEGFPRSTPEPEPSSRHLHAGHHLASQQAPARPIPGQDPGPGFDAIQDVSTLQQWFTYVRLLGSHLTHPVRLFRSAHHPGSFTAAACGGLRPPPAWAVPEGLPPSPVQHRDHQHDLLHRNLQPRSWHTDLDVLTRRVQPRQPQPRQQRPHHQVDQLQRHERRSSQVAEVFGTLKVHL